MEKECQIILLPTKEASNIHLEDGGILMFYKEARIYSNTTPQHLYILSSDKIEVGDYVYLPTGAVIQHNNKTIVGYANKAKFQKVIATTNPKLLMGEFIDDGSQSGFGFYKDTVASISQSDIEYIVNLFTNKEKKNLGTIVTAYQIGNVSGNDKKFTLEDMYMLSAFITDFIAGRKGDFTIVTPKNVADKFIQSLTKEQSKNDTVMVEYEEEKNYMAIYQPKLKDGSIVIHQ